MSKFKGLFTALRGDWKTPKAFYQALDALYQFDFDPCPPNPKFDGLNCDWGQSNFVNPPYSDIETWIQKCEAEAQKGKTVVLLVPSRTDTKWWHDFAMKADEIRFIRGRLKFDDQTNNAPFPSVLIIWRS